MCVNVSPACCLNPKVTVETGLQPLGLLTSSNTLQVSQAFTLGFGAFWEKTRHDMMQILNHFLADITSLALQCIFVLQG